MKESAAVNPPPPVVRLFPGGSGRFIINGKEGMEFMPRLGDMELCMAPLTHIGQERHYDVSFARQTAAA